MRNADDAAGSLPLTLPPGATSFDVMPGHKHLKDPRTPICWEIPADCRAVYFGDTLRNPDWDEKEVDELCLSVIRPGKDVVLNSACDRYIGSTRVCVRGGTDYEANWRRGSHLPAPPARLPLADADRARLWLDGLGEAVRTELRDLLLDDPPDGVVMDWVEDHAGERAWQTGLDIDNFGLLHRDEETLTLAVGDEVDVSGSPQSPEFPRGVLIGLDTCLAVFHPAGGDVRDIRCLGLECLLRINHQADHRRRMIERHTVDLDAVLAELRRTTPPCR